MPTDPVERAILGFLSKYHGNTFLSYRTNLVVYGNWCNERRIHPLTIGRVELAVYLRWLQDQNLAPSTVAQRFGTVRCFLRYAYRAEIITTNSGDFVESPRVDRDAQYRTWLNPLELAAMVKTATRSSIRDHLLIAVMGQMGLRVGEACSLTVESVSPVEGMEVLRFIGKGNKAAIIGVPIPVLRPLHQLMEQRRTGALFVTRTGRKMDRRDAARVVEKIAKRAGIDHHITPHALRRGFATAGMYAGVSRGELQDATRHKDQSTLLLYLKPHEQIIAASTNKIASFVSGLSN